MHSAMQAQQFVVGDAGPPDEARDPKGEWTASGGAIGTSEFKKWFGNSKVVDKHGSPLVVYHGSKSDFDTFDIKKFGASDEGLAGKGFYFTYNPEEASGYALNEMFGGKDGNPNVKPAYVSLKNPFVIKHGILPDGRKIQDLHKGGINYKSGNYVRKLAEDGGHDGVIFANRDGVPKHVVAFKAEQIKSAISNTGKFDPKKPGIRDSSPHPQLPGSDKVKAFQSWIDEAMRQVVMGYTGVWVDKYIEDAGKLASERAGRLVGRTAVQKDASPLNRLQALISLTQTELQGVCEAVSQQAVRVMTHGLLSNQPPKKIARAVADRVVKVGRVRGNMIVQYMVVKAFGSATLESFRQAGVRRVGTVAEKVRVVRGPHGLTAARDAGPEDEARDPKGQWTSGSENIDNAIKEGLKTANTGSIDEIIKPRAEHSYRFLTGDEYSHALSTGKLSPGINSGGLLNFSAKPIAVYGASAWRTRGLLVEMSNDAIASRKSASFYPTSTDSSAFLRHESIPLSEASRVFGYQWDNGIKAVDVTHLTNKIKTKDAATNVIDMPRGPGSRTKEPSASTIGRIEKAQRVVEELGEVDVLTAGDDDVCEECQDISDSGPYDIDTAESLIPAHPNAVLQGTTIASYGVMHDLVRAVFKGPAICLRTSAKKFAIGPNHPMLTRRGFVKARDLNEGDELVYDVRTDSRAPASAESTGASDLEQMPLIEDVFSAQALRGKRSCIASHLDLHGDGVFCESEVEVVNPERDLLPIFDLRGIEHFCKAALVRANMDLIEEARGSASSLFVDRCFSAAQTTMETFHHYVALLFDHLRPRQMELVAYATNGYTLFLQDIDQSEAVPMEAATERPESLAAKIHLGDCFRFDRVISAHVEQFSGLAFDASTATGLYNNNGYLVKNCRCAFIPTSDERFAEVGDAGPADEERDEKGKWSSGAALETLAQQLTKQYGLARLNLFNVRGALHLSDIEVPKTVRRSGVGSAVMQEIVKYADTHGMRIILSPGQRDDRHGTTSRSRLVTFYKQFGFVENKGRNTDFTISEGMYREPKSNNTTQ
jgi:hypothetical protein